MARDKLIWGIFLTFYIKSFLKMYVNAAVGVSEEEKTQAQRLVPFLILLVMSSSPIFMIAGLSNLRNHFENPDIQRKYGALTLNLRTDTAPCYTFNLFFVLRRMFYGLSIAFLGSNPTSQTFVQVLMSMAHLVYVQQHMPYSIRIDNLFEIGNELTILAVLTTSVRYADRAPTPETASNWGFFQISIISLNIAVNLGYFIYENGKLVITKIKEFLKKRK